MKEVFTLRAFIIGSILCFCIGAGEPFGVMCLGGSPLANDHSAGAAIFLFFILTFGVNLFLKKLNPKLALNPSELALVYLMMLIACAIPSWGFTMNLLFLISGVTYYATPENNWIELIHPHIAPWLIPHDNEAIRYFFEGLPKGSPLPWLAWIKPLLTWIPFILIVYLTMVCLAVIFRKQWIEKERLLFPLVELPTRMIKEEEGSFVPAFYKNKLMWLGFLIPFVLNSFTMLHHYYPYIPSAQLGSNFPIFDRTVYVPLMVKFEIIGIAYLLATNISLSIWFFSLFLAFEMGLFNKIGFGIGLIDIYSHPAPPALAYQQLGAFLLFALSAIWFAKNHLKDVLRKAFKGDKAIDDSGECMSYRSAVLGTILGFISIAIWVKLSGFNALSAIIFITVAFLIYIGLSKIVCQAGVAYGRQPVAPGVVTMNAVGGTNMGPGGITAVGFSFPYAGDIRTLVMGMVSQGLKLADVFGVKGRKILIAILLALLIGLFSSIWAVVVIGYKYGGVNCFGWQPKDMSNFTFDWVRENILHPVHIDWRRFSFLGIGAGLMLLMTIARTRLLWWPIHPIGMTIGLTIPTYWVWFSFFLGWLIKSLILKYGGPKPYRLLLPLFLGFILGVFTSAAIWNIIGFLTNRGAPNLTLG